MIERKRYLDKIRPFLGEPFVKVITGMRRVGKSTLLLQIRDNLLGQGVPPGNIVMINKDLLEWDHIRTYADVEAEVKKQLERSHGACWIIIDEVQEIEGWERAVNSFLAEGAGDIIITGSNARLLSAELSTLLTGRYIEIPVYPLGFGEFLDFRENFGHSADPREAFGLFLRYGGLPGIHVLDMEDEQVLPYLEAILNTILMKDVFKRHNIRDVAHLERILSFIFDNCGNLTSARNIASFFKNQNITITPDTVIAYLGYIEEAFLIRRVGRYGIRGKKHLEYLDKYYIADPGLRHGLKGPRDADISGLLENIVYLELERRGYSTRVGVLQDGEIDFVAERGDTRMYIQVAYLLAEESTVEREFGNLERINDNYPKIVLSLDDYFPGNRRGIRHINIRDFLLNESPGILAT